MGRKPRKDGALDPRGLEGQEKTVSRAADRGGARQAPPACVGGPAKLRGRNLYGAAICGFLLLAVTLIFGATVRYDFVNFDDNKYVSENPQLAHGLTVEGIVWAFTTVHCSNWHPLTWLSYLLDYQLYGLNPWGYHLTNLLLHAATTILLFLLLWRMTGDLWPSAFVAAVFAIHPLRVESVAWIAERKDVLSGLFFVLTVGTYVGYVRRPFSLVRYLTVVLLFALGLMAKPMLVTLPFVLLLLDYWPLRRMVRPQQESQRSLFVPWRLAVEKLPLLALSAASCVATTMAQWRTVQRLDVLPYYSRAANALVSYVAYLGQLFCPTGLTVFYPHPGNDLPIWKVLTALLVLVCLCVGVLAWRWRYPYLLVAWFWYLGMLVPVIGLVQVGRQSMADRYTYLPQIGLLIGLAWGARRVFQSWPYRAWLWGVTSALVMAALMGCAWRQTSHWRNAEVMWRHALDCTSRNALAHTSLGTALSEQGRVDEAIAHFREAVLIDPQDVGAHVGLGGLLYVQRHPDEARLHFQTALQIDPQYAEALTGFGVLLYAQSHFDEAIAYFRKAVEIKPDYAVAHLDLGNALGAQGKLDEALAAFQKVLELKPDDPAARHNLGVLLYRHGRISEAIVQWHELLRLQPDNIPILLRLAWTLATSPEASVRNGREAVALAERAARLTRGRDATILDSLAAAYAEAGRFSDAVQTAEQALALASSQNNAAHADALRARIKLYQLGSPYRDTPQPRLSHPITP